MVESAVMLVFAALVAVAAFPPMDSPEAVPVMLVPTKAEGVPRLGVTNVGEVARTTFPEPVEPVKTGACATVPVPVEVKN